jgi:hypothetical protein
MRDPGGIAVTPPLRCSIDWDERGQHLGLMLDQQGRDRTGALRPADDEFVDFGRDGKPASGAWRNSISPSIRRAVPDLD